MATRGVNKVILIGNLGAEPEVRFMPNGNAVANVSLATSSSWRDKQSGEMQERTEWHRIVFFNRLAEIVKDYVHKGSRIYIDGSLRTRKWQDKSGVDRYTTEIVANEMQMLDRPAGGAQGGGRSEGQFDSAPATAGADGSAATASAPADSFSDDDIPF